MTRTAIFRLLPMAICAMLALSPVRAGLTLPAPVLQYTGKEYYSTAAGAFIRYRFDVTNKSAFPAAMFAPAPGLPPCGANTNSSRTWVDFFDQNGRRLYGFCALGTNTALDSLWFAVPQDQPPPDGVYIEMIDRQTNSRLRSNTAPVR